MLFTAIFILFNYLFKLIVQNTWVNKINLISLICNLLII